MGKSVAIASNSSDTVTNGENISTTNVKSTSKAESAKFGNTFLTLDMAKITDGMQLTIAGESKTFAVGSNSKVTINSDAIDLRAYTDLDSASGKGAASSAAHLSLAKKMHHADSATF